jgi:hypothetical protein
MTGRRNGLWTRGRKWVNSETPFWRASRRVDLSLARKLVLATAIKLAALAAIWALCFAPASRGPIDTAAHIAGRTLTP